MLVLLAGQLVVVRGGQVQGGAAAAVVVMRIRRQLLRPQLLLLLGAQRQVNRRLLFALLAAAVRSALPAARCIDPAVFQEFLVALPLAGTGRPPRLPRDQRDSSGSAADGQRHRHVAVVGDTIAVAVRPPHLGHQRHLPVVVDLGHAGRRLVGQLLHRREEAQADVLGREAREHRVDEGLVLRPDRPDQGRGL